MIQEGLRSIKKSSFKIAALFYHINGEGDIAIFFILNGVILIFS